jgi:hypothetical protein
VERLGGPVPAPEDVVSARAPIADLEPLWTVEDVMHFLRRSRRWVYGHADELGAIREFGGLRFNPAALRARAAGAKVLTFPPKAR